MNVVRTIVDGPIGPLTVIVDDDIAAVTEVRFPGHGATDIDVIPRADGHPVLAQAARELGEYFAGQRTTFDVDLAPRGTPFQLAAWEALLSIPYGETVSYREQARRLGDVNKSRAVGAANGRNPIPIIVPCHRVVGSDGSLTGFGGGLDTKAWLLDHERSVAETDLRLF
jgi:methylated-DNA-[protein]-cysteine S-methyltransferase